VGAFGGREHGFGWAVVGLATIVRASVCSAADGKLAMPARQRPWQGSLRLRGERITEAISSSLDEADAKVLVNLASEEYFKSLQPKKLPVPVLQPVFEDWSGGRFRVISFYAKRARGLMARYAIVNRLTDAAGLKEFAVDGYGYADQARLKARCRSCRRTSRQKTPEHSSCCRTTMTRRVDCSAGRTASIVIPMDQECAAPGPCSFPPGFAQNSPC
jgi:hypothetical protein